jgi:hypothetical protein
MSDLAKRGPDTVDGYLRGMVAQVSPDRRTMALRAMEFFGDKPTQAGLNESILAQKLALLFHRGGYTNAQIIRAMQALDETERFRPTMAEWKRELERVAADDAQREHEDRRLQRALERKAEEAPQEVPVYTEAERAERIAAIRRTCGNVVPPYEPGQE